MTIPIYKTKTEGVPAKTPCEQATLVIREPGHQVQCLTKNYTRQSQTAQQSTHPVQVGKHLTHYAFPFNLTNGQAQTQIWTK